MHHISNVEIVDPVIFLFGGQNCLDVTSELIVNNRVALTSVSSLTCKRRISDNVIVLLKVNLTVFLGLGAGISQLKWDSLVNKLLFEHLVPV